MIDFRIKMLIAKQIWNLSAIGNDSVDAHPRWFPCVGTSVALCCHSAERNVVVIGMPLCLCWYPLPRTVPCTNVIPAWYRRNVDALAASLFLILVSAVSAMATVGYGYGGGCCDGEEELRESLESEDEEVCSSDGRWHGGQWSDRLEQRRCISRQR